MSNNPALDRRIRIARQLGDIMRVDGECVDYEKLESHPRFRPHWLEDQELKNEWTKLLLELT